MDSKRQLDTAKTYKLAYEREKIEHLLSEKLLDTKIHKLYTKNQVLSSQYQTLRKHTEEIEANYLHLKKSLTNLKKLAHYDVITGVPNRSYFNATLKEELEKSENFGHRFALLYVDLDYFKVINDQFGHHLGDTLLQSVAMRLRQNVRTDDFVARIGGDEFAIILKNLNEISNAETIAQEILRALSSPYKLDGHSITISGSIGISIYPESGKDVRTLCRNSDLAMYRAKENGRNNYQYFKESFAFEQRRRFEIQKSLHSAIKKQELFLVYQPTYNLSTKKISGIEVLIRWQHPKLGLVTPNEFIEIAEENKTIIPIGAWVLEMAFQQYVEWQKVKQVDCILMINLSVEQLKQKNFAEDVIELLHKTGMSPENLEFEIAENMLMTHLEELQKTLKKIHKIGIKIGIDKFGIGYSSLNQLKKLKPNTLKIDMSFLKNIHFRSKSHNHLIMKAIVLLAKGLNLNVIAEGVEEEIQESFLKSNDCQEAQGYYYHRPMSADKISMLLNKGVN
jgi:diguanylate cyclase (GGDEF)-like protein